MSDTKPSILVVDDEEIILLALAETIEQTEEFSVVKAATPHEALEHLKTQPFVAIISDQMMPDMTGLELLAEASNIQPHISTVLITGVLNLKTVIDAINQGEIFRFIAKPWVREELLATVKNASQRHQLLSKNSELLEETQTLNNKLKTKTGELEQNLSFIHEQKDELHEAHESLKNSFGQSLELCQKIIGTYNPLLGKETQVVVRLCKEMAEVANLSAKDRQDLEASAWLHKIGLLGVSRHIISKARRTPKKLTENERLLMRNHPITGQTMVSFVDDLIEASRLVRAQYERWDGKGSPDGLLGENIPWTARLLAIAVYYVESNRPSAESVDEICKLSGTAFCPEAVRIFTKATEMVQLPKRVREVLFGELRSGMTLAQGIHSPSGLLLLPEDSMLNQRNLQKISEHNEVDPIEERLFVYT